MDIGSPTTFLDTHPDEQRTSYIGSGLTFIKGQLYTAFTGIVPKPLLAGTLRIIWYTDTNKEGMKDYELHQSTLVRENYEMLCAHPDIRRVVVMGYSGQNPWVLGNAGRSEKMDKDLRKMKAEARRARAREAEMVSGDGTGDVGEVGMGELVDIEGIIEQSDRQDEEKRRKVEDKTWKESEGLLSGEMV